MTLGGLALAVGILVDDATVTIENINYHLEQGKEVETAIMDGASQIVIPAFVSLLCICIVFIPMFFLSGVARFLFVPLAESVMFAMIFSFLLSRTLVPTMAKYLLHMHVPRVAGGDVEPSQTKNPLVRFQRGFEERFTRMRAGYHELLALAIEHRRLFVGGFIGFIAVSFLLAPFLGRNFFPQVDGGQILLHVRAPVGMRIEETASRFAEVEKAIRQVIPPVEVGRRSRTTSALMFRRSIRSTTIPARSASRTETSRSRSKKGMRRPPITSGACARNCRAVFPA